MTALPPLSISVSSKRRACVLDIELALSRFGLLAAQRLSDEFNLWISLDLWRILDTPESYFIDPAATLRVLNRMSQEEVRFVLSQWCAARIETDLAGAKLFWIGDDMRESFLPEGTDPHLPYRYEVLARSLQELVGGGYMPEKVHRDVPENAYEVAALSAALMPYGSFILTCFSADPAGEPDLCDYLRGTCRMSVQKARHSDLIQSERAWLMPVLARAGVLELLWARLNLAVVHLIVPNAIVIPSPEKADDPYVLEFPSTGYSAGNPVPGDGWWKNAECFWYPVVAPQ